MYRDKYMLIKPPPPNNLDSKSLAIWASWSTLSEKEVAREAVMKGTHIELAKLFLSKKLDVDDTNKWFKNEIDAWILDLLLRKQTYRVMHIFENLGADPFMEMLTIFLDTSCKELRQIVGNHLIKHQKLSEIHINNWHLLTAIESQSDILTTLNEKYISVNLKCINQQSDEWRSNMGTELLFRIFEMAWLYLLKSNTDLLKYWINLYYSKNEPIINTTNLNTEILQKINEIFLDLEINAEMITQITNNKNCINETVQTEILNELAKFGVFSDSDKTNLLSIIKRLLETDKLNYIEEVLNEKTSNLSLSDFYKLLIDYCITNKLYTVLNICCEDFIPYDKIESTSNVIDIILNNYEMSRNINNKEILRNNIFEVANFLCKDDLLSYFTSQPLILLSIIIFTNGVSIEDLLSKRVTLKIKDFEVNKETLLHCLKDYRYLVHFCNKYDKAIDFNVLTYYDLLKRHAEIRTNNIYKHRYSNTAFPTFNSAELIEKYGYKKDIDFIYFLKNSRPLYAYNFFKTNYLNHDINEMDYMNFIDKIYRVALRNFKCQSITTSCIAFLEMLDENSYPLRLYLKSANIIFNCGKTSEHELQQLFSNILRNCDEIYTLLEKSVVENMHLDLNSSGSDFTNALESYSIVTRFSVLHKLQMPELFLKFCAKNDLWLPFLIYIQIYNYPVDVISKLLQNFTSRSITEHISHAVTHDIQLEEIRNQLIGERDSRKYFLSRLGVRLTDSSGASSDMSSHSSYGSMANSISSDFLESETLDYQTDLLEVLIKCHNSVDPPKALLFAARYYKSPLLAVLANSYEPDSVITNWVTWLEVSCDIKQSFINYDGVITADSVLEMFKHILKKNYFKTLTNGFTIFLPENPICAITSFLNETTQLNFDTNLLDLLKSFKKKITYWRSNSYISEIDHDMSYFNNKLWIQNTAIFLLSATLQYGFKCFYDQILFLRYLNEIEISQYFLTDLPDLKTYLQIIEYIYENQYEISFDLSVISNKNKCTNAIKSYISDLVAKGRYDAALNLAKIMNISCDFIIFDQLNNEFESMSSRNEEFWRKWNKIFEEYDICPDVIVDKYLEFIQKISDKDEIFTLYKLAFNCTSKYKLENSVDVEKELWLSYFQLDDNSKKFKQILSNEEFTTLSDYTKELQIIPECYDSLNEIEMANFEKIIDYSLDNEDIITALRLEKMFGCTSMDLNILKLCLSLVEGTVLPHQLTARQRLLLNRRNNIKSSASIRRKTYKTLNRISSCASVGKIVKHETDHLNQTISELRNEIVMLRESNIQLIHMLTNQNNLVTSNRAPTKENTLKKKNVTFAETVKCNTKNADTINKQMKEKATLDTDRPEIVNENLNRESWNIVTTKSNKRIKKREVIRGSDTSSSIKGVVADLLYTEISIALTHYSVSKMNICFLWDLNMDLDFNLILQLLPDNCSLLGFKLYYGCSNEFTTGNMIRVTELLIRCHDCFTADCNMEGISMVLKKCKSFTSLLEGVQEYNLMVRLLTGIARYTEMTYIFHILRQQEQFELLLRKGSRKDGGLKMALLEYLKKYCPDDVDLYKIVALHFFLFSEIAELWEQEAIKYTRRIIALAKLEMQNCRLNPDTEPFVLLVNTEDNKKLLRKIMSKYSHAAEYHLHGQKLTKAMTAARQAQLVALQLSLYKDLTQGATATCILNLTNVQINKLVLSEFNFQQILIIIEAFNFEIDWSNILFEQYVVKDRSDFFQSFALSLPITENLVHDISRTYLNFPKATPSMDKNMRIILHHLNSLHAKYRIASELGFTNLVEELLNSQQLSYLKDTVWKSGYKNADE
ncbi:hypothetical protein MML48_2g00007702 [Holotrichia oblita]|uniref:Uncharacterized protein n=1 Tax=Holotrichia oblita TaxID=644536 RepID=A0ACB9TKQ7_HOLOL|nr:hypothetical protein MML48_2g00007702 [Holotrichia oblita]